MLIKAISKFSNDTPYEVRAVDDIYIGSRVDIYAALDGSGAAVYYGDSRAPVITVLGEVFSGDVGLQLNSTSAAGAAGNLALITVAKGARVTSYNEAVLLNSMALRLVNDGVVSSSNNNAISQIGLEGSALIVNRGRILADSDAISIGAALPGGRVAVFNSGLIQGEANAIADEGPAVGTKWFIRNTGTIFGHINLYDANDVVDNAKGRLFGTVNLYAGNDRYLPGANAGEDVRGGAGTDVLDFSTGGRVDLYLRSTSLNTGRARGDAYSDFEIFIGARSGGDRLIDDRVEIHHGDFRGLGGNDTIDGGFGDDRINGGLGRDNLTGGMGVDKFIYGSAREGGDRLTDFISGVDKIQVSGAGFGIARSMRGQTLDDDLFHSSTTNRAAERNDRFIFRTGDFTLWFDRDGSGGAAPVFLARLPLNAGLDYSDIFVL